jgi:hypothetical protein
MKEHYAAVLAELQTRKSKLEAELREIDAMIGGLQRLIGDEPLQELLVPSPQPSSSAIDLAQAINKLPGVNLALLSSRSRFSNISVRWGVIWYLAEDVVGPETAKTGEIASALLEGGHRTQAKRFPNLVSAVLSGMKTKGEVETGKDGGYRLTEQGRQTYESIRHSAKFRHAISNELLMLGEQ